MELAVDRVALGVDQFEGVGSVAVHMAISVRQATIAEQERHLGDERDRNEDHETGTAVKSVLVGERSLYLQCEYSDPCTINSTCRVTVILFCTTTPC